MADSVYAPPKAHLDAGHVRQDKAFYVVSPLKMMVLFFVTMGMYGLVWHYKNWLMYRRSEQIAQSPDADIWPALRAFFGLFFTHALMDEVKAHGAKENREARGNPRSIATMIVVLTILSYGLNFLPKRPPYTMMALPALLAFVVAIMFAYRAAQRYINESCGDPLGQTNARFTAANVVWVILGLLFWALTIIGTYFGPQPQAMAS